MLFALEPASLEVLVAAARAALAPVGRESVALEEVTAWDQAKAAVILRREAVGVDEGTDDLEWVGRRPWPLCKSGSPG